VEVPLAGVQHALAQALVRHLAADPAQAPATEQPIDNPARA
jgi:hypothetical protein